MYFVLKFQRDRGYYGGEDMVVGREIWWQELNVDQLCLQFIVLSIELEFVYKVLRFDYSDIVVF